MLPVLLCLSSSLLYAQVSTSDSLNQNDSTNNVSVTDSSSQASGQDWASLGVKIASDALPAKVTTFAKDSAVLDIKDSKFYLYGETKVNYEDIEVQSGKMIYYQKSNELAAEPILDTSGQKISLQEFKQGAETFTYDTLKYNFKSKRALVRNARTVYGDAFINSTQVKRNADGSIFGYKSYYTTCNVEDHPHFAIRAKRIKTIPERIVASGPANLEIMDIPTPLFLPFGMFPIKQGQRSGFILPTYTMEERRGLGLQRGGYYFAINDYLGLVSQFDIFTKGSWGTVNTLQYTNRYRYRGSLNVNYSYQQTGEAYMAGQTRSTDFSVAWQHSVDPKARPGSTFGANVNFGSRTYNLLNGMDLNNTLNNQYNSSISYSKTWVGKPYSFTMALRHSQEVSTGIMTIALPEINFNLGQFTPFQRKNAIGLSKWYEKISVTYGIAAINNINTYDSLFGVNTFTPANMRTGINHNTAVNASYNVFKYLTWTTGATYREFWTTQKLYLRNNGQGGIDSAQDIGFFTARDLNVTTGLSTRIFGMKTFRKGRLAGIRHVFNPTVGLGYQPSYAQGFFQYLYSNVNQLGLTEYKSPFVNVNAGLSTNAIPIGGINFNLNNTLQIKVRNRDSTGSINTKNISLIDRFALSGNYNLFADSNNLSDITMGFGTNILNKFNFTSGASFTPYRYNGAYRTKEYLATTGGGLAKLNNIQFGLSMAFRGAKKNAEEQEDAMNKDGDVKRLLENGGYDDYYDFNIPWDVNISSGLSINRVYRIDMKDTLRYNPYLTINGSFNLTENWKFSGNTGLQFTGLQKVEVATTQITISRDLHCWQMNLSLIPIGFNKSFNFALQVKSSVLQDLKLTRRRSMFDNAF